jgi:hypothetical protein
MGLIGRMESDTEREYRAIYMPRRLRRGRLRHEPFTMKINTNHVMDVKR